MRATTTFLASTAATVALLGSSVAEAVADGAGPTGGGTGTPVGRAAEGLDLATRLRWAADEARAPRRRIMPLRRIGQRRSDYCGPASGRMIVAGWRRWHSRVSGRMLNQRRMARHMRFGQYGYVPYSSRNFAHGVNRWLFGRKHAYYQQRDFYSASGRWRQRIFRRAVVANVSRDHPVAASTVEWKNLPWQRYNGHPRHPSDDIGHWVVVRGYTWKGRNVVVNDPAWTVFSSAQPAFRIRSRRFARVFIDNGIVA